MAGPGVALPGLWQGAGKVVPDPAIQCSPVEGRSQFRMFSCLCPSFGVRVLRSCSPVLRGLAQCPEGCWLSCFPGGLRIRASKGRGGGFVHFSCPSPPPPPGRPPRESPTSLTPSICLQVFGTQQFIAPLAKVSSSALLSPVSHSRSCPLVLAGGHLY